MPAWKINRYSGAKGIPESVQHSTTKRIRAEAERLHPGKFIRIDVRYRGAYAYVDAFEEPGDLHGKPPPGETREEWLERLRNTPYHLCRIRYFGNPDLWAFAFYNYSHEKYEPSFTLTGDHRCTPEVAYATAAMFL